VKSVAPRRWRGRGAPDLSQNQKRYCTAQPPDPGKLNSAELDSVPCRTGTRRHAPWRRQNQPRRVETTS